MYILSLALVLAYEHIEANICLSIEFISLKKKKMVVTIVCFFTCLWQVSSRLNSYNYHYLLLSLDPPQSDPCFLGEHLTFEDAEYVVELYCQTAYSEDLQNKLHSKPVHMLVPTPNLPFPKKYHKTIYIT